jgi:hypothetical protein
MTTRNSRYWSTEKTQLIPSVTLLDVKVGVCCNLHERTIIGPVFYV